MKKIVIGVLFVVGIQTQAIHDDEFGYDQPSCYNFKRLKRNMRRWKNITHARMRSWFEKKEKTIEELLDDAYRYKRY